MIYSVAALTALIPYLLLTWFLGSFLKLKSPDIWILRAGLALIGVAFVALFIWYRAKKEREKKASEPASAAGGGDELDALLNEAAAKLASSRLQQGASFGALPVIFLMGPTGSTKTTSIVNSGLDAELLAGQIFQDSAIVPTRSANLWFARKAVFVEASGKLLGDLPAWSRLIRRMQPRRLGSLFGKGEQAPRAAVVCLPCDIFLKPGATENLSVAARTLAARTLGLGEVSQLLGINVPVYVLFTKLDRLSFFHEYVHHLMEPEVTEVLGVTLAGAPLQATGVYAEQETARLTAAFSQLFYSLAEKRTRMLSRENEPEKLPGIYEFPREFRKLRTAAVQFLVDLCRPSQLSSGPFLRGFYFCGVRPLIVREVVAAAAPRQSAKQSAQVRGDATGIFRQDQLAAPQSAPHTPAPVATTTRKVPQWVFLSHFFSDVLLTDRVGLGASGSSEKTNTLRRVLLGAAAALCLLLMLAFTISYAGNRSLESDAREAAARIKAPGADGANLASVDALTRLEGLRQSLETLTRYEREGAPLHLRWGLYAGSQIYPDVRKLYFQRFHQVLLTPTQASMVATLQGLSPTTDYEYAYDTLKAYLITTSHHNKSTQVFLAPALTTRWVAGRPVDPEQPRLARKQFDFYSEELLADASGFATANDTGTVEKARAYLSAFAGAERVYPVMLAEANKNNPGVNFNRKFAGSSEVVINNKDVAGAYTKAGWTFMQNAIKNADSFFNREEWVLGSRSGMKKDAKLEQDLRARYYSDFISQWQDYLRRSAVVPYRDFGDAAKKLSKIDGPQSPLLALFWLASQNTGVDSPDVVKAFKALHAVMPPANVDQYISPSNADYMKALVPLQLALEQIATLPPAQSDQAAEQTRSAASAAKLVTRQMALTLALDQTMLKLLEDPITHALGAIPAPPTPGKGFCNEFKALSLKYPFNPSSTAKATIEDMAAFFAPQKGILWTFYEQNLKKSLTPQGTLIPGVTPAPVAGVVRFFGRAVAFSKALYPDGTATPKLVYSLKPVMSADIQSLRLGIDGQTGDFPAPGAPAKQFAWPGSTAHEVRLSGKFKGGSDFVFPSYDGLWAVFEFFGDADRYQPAGSGASLEWMLRGGRQGRPVTSPTSGQPLQVHFDLDMAGAPPVFQKSYFPSLSCLESAK